jgi:hypothetical protein
MSIGLLYYYASCKEYQSELLLTIVVTRLSSTSMT